MVICCAAFNCSNRQGKGKKGAISFHRFPLKDSKRVTQWLKAVQRNNWTPTKYSFLCSEHFSKDCFSKRFEDQHRFLKPTAVPSIFQSAEKRATCGYAICKRETNSQIPEDEDAQPTNGESREQHSLLVPLDQDTGVKHKMKGPERTTVEAYTLDSEQRENIVLLSESLLTRASVLKTGSPVRTERSSSENGTQTNIHIGNWMTDTSGISIDDFSPPVSGACKFIGSLHSYSFSSKHSRERPSVPRDLPERKKAKRNTEPNNSSGNVPLVPDKSSLEISSPSPLTVAPQKSSESPSVAPADLTPKSATEASTSEKGAANPNFMSINEVIVSASGTCKLIDSLHTYCFSSRQTKSQVCCLREQVEKKNMELKLLRQRVSRSDSQVKKLREKVAELKRLSIPGRGSLQSMKSEMSLLNPILKPLVWMLGTWVSEPPGDGIFPTIQPFHYMEEIQISHVGQPVLNFMFNAFHPDTKKPMHRECGFIRLKPGTSKVAFVSAQNTGIVEVEEGEVNGEELTITSHSVARISFAKEPHVQQISRNFRLTADGKLEQTVSMATSAQPMTKHLHITYKKVTP
ncbi:peroxynitrite isomerase THAP4 isoform X1 [Microcaecilia unicolor]|uniref:THAP domain-containing protein 4 isoform X1 n=3 Tax=Microcaecilia unicolor TaxID=1415580 RepID=A0A6P7Z832_9AMPH|nr:THAP domain-containing protein 4 isoform X1 [Microcaecilia unicolor]